MQSLPSPSQTSAHHGDAASEANSCPLPPLGKSDVARLLRQIDLEYEAAQQGITGLAVGTARHDFINARMEQVAVYQEQLATCVGETEATRLIYDHYAQHIGQSDQLYATSGDNAASLAAQCPLLLTPC